MASSTPKIWIDGCFDLFHHGHANAIRQAAHFGPVTVGVHSDDAIEFNKGPPVLTLAERVRLVGACRWIAGPDSVDSGAPYVTEVDYVRQRGIDYVVHVTTDADGNDTYAFVKAAGMYRECKRTEGVSTTDAIARVLTGSNVNPVAPMSEPVYYELLDLFASTSAAPCPPRKRENEADAWAARPPRPRPGQRIYVLGPFDGFLPEHVDLLEELSDAGHHVTVAVLSSEDVHTYTGRPAIFSLQERTLSVLQCKFVDAVSTSALSIEAVRPQYDRIIELPVMPSTLYDRIEARRPALEARQARKLGKSQVETRLQATATSAA